METNPSYPLQAITSIVDSYDDLYDYFFSVGEYFDRRGDEDRFTEIDINQQFIVINHPEGLAKPKTVKFIEFLMRKLHDAIESSYVELWRYKELNGRDNWEWIRQCIKERLSEVINGFYQSKWIITCPKCVEVVSALFTRKLFQDDHDLSYAFSLSQIKHTDETLRMIYDLRYKNQFFVDRMKTSFEVFKSVVNNDHTQVCTTPIHLACDTKVAIETLIELKKNNIISNATNWRLIEKFKLFSTKSSINKKGNNLTYKNASSNLAKVTQKHSKLFDVLVEKIKNIR